MSETQDGERELVIEVGKIERRIMLLEERKEQLLDELEEEYNYDPWEIHD